MNKYIWFMLTVIYLILITFVIDAAADLGEYSISSGVPDSLGDVDANTLAKAWGFLKTYFNLLFFNVDGFPVALSLLFFHSVAMANGILLLDVLKDMLPFT